MEGFPKEKRAKHKGAQRKQNQVTPHRALRCLNRWSYLHQSRSTILPECLPVETSRPAGAKPYREQASGMHPNFANAAHPPEGIKKKRAVLSARLRSSLLSPSASRSAFWAFRRAFYIKRWLSNRQFHPSAPGAKCRSFAVSGEMPRKKAHGEHGKNLFRGLHLWATTRYCRPNSRHRKGRAR